MHAKRHDYYTASTATPTPHIIVTCIDQQQLTNDEARTSTPPAHIRRNWSSWSDLPQFRYSPTSYARTCCLVPTHSVHCRVPSLVAPAGQQRVAMERASTSSTCTDDDVNLTPRGAQPHENGSTHLQVSNMLSLPNRCCAHCERTHVHLDHPHYDHRSSRRAAGVRRPDGKLFPLVRCPTKRR
jgi:hypothetical protein